jgi:hypothetical protein
LGWRCGSNGRAPAWPTQGPEFKLQHHKKKKIRNKNATAKVIKTPLTLLQNVHKYKY